MRPRKFSICLGTASSALVGLWLSAALGGDEAPQAQSGPAPAVRVLVAYYTLSGNTERMAQAVAQGIERVPGVVAVVKKVEDATKDDLEDADGIVLGSPTYFGDMAGKMKVVIDDWNWKLGVDFTDKVGGAFSTGGGPAGGKEHTIISLLLFMINNRMVVAGPLYEGRTPNKGWAELGGTAATGPSDPGLSEVELDTAQRVGERVARLAKKLRTK